MRWTSSSADWRLRAGLLAVLAALLGTSIALSGAPRLHPIATPIRVTDPSPAAVALPSSAPTPVPPRVTAPTHPPGTCGLTPADVAPGPVGHCTILEIGDSLGADLGWGLAREVAASSGLDLIQLDKPSTGLANSAYYNWPEELAAALRRYRPQLVLVCLGGNDQQGITGAGTAPQFPTPGWQRAYLLRVQQIVDLAGRSGADLLWVGLPVMQDPWFSSGAALLNRLYREGTGSTSRATFLPVWSLFANPGGAFQSDVLVNGSPATLRQPDGIHFSFAGEDVLATYVIRAIAAIYHVRLTPADPSAVTGW